MSGSRERVDQNMNYYYPQERVEQGWQQQPDTTRQGRGQSWIGDSAETAHWVNAAPVGYQSSTPGEGWNVGTKHGFDNRAVLGQQYPQVASGSTSAEMSMNGNLPQQQAFLDRSGVLLGSDVPYQFPPYNPSPQGIGHGYDRVSRSYIPSTGGFEDPSNFSSDPGQSHEFWGDHSAAPHSPYSYSSSGIEPYSPPPELHLGNVNDSVACPHGCGTILTGVHAFGNLTRHLKTKGCSASGKAKVEHLCQVHGCGRKYSRSDGLRVHMRRRHGAGLPQKPGLLDQSHDDEP
ncbi:hypothetical protein HBH56_088080 [Parastagonospora nodorum]|uniref:C2H2-type domain-containing protein n=1 Tax=Phaeosphaeria nodorum (strain SN15 / ATCC MYA-4574 / FGSC 10173) TaxID=321614 RepID=A0A7U2F3G9_PHANO|nr:hypothetical protein HBH56_088080 [Parastagonospora nodorum]QRC98021.1 hypothetical protein JI435_435420 [Parastagonospora nodorum SN15]KAH3936093.1 hypothetical protein HBH54_022720 [Parastagonospora nodorum]KAH4145110.1 hypothetical protein HBH45_013200 [Parastagonospora nodorum]KAH4162112.1 hypothetical protein HBH44_085580 [Parastagonospora nodorum]